jgi:NAD(P)-dependent dehydrogenase (short-subunit alcohol dehydrogenase family)
MKALPGLVFITGAGSGIGQALALGYAREGARLALAVRRPDEMRDWLAANLAGQSGHEVYQADVRQRDRIVAAGHQCLSKQGVPDIVIAAAGVSVGVDSRERADLEVMADVMDTNLLGTAATFHPFIEPMQRRGRGCLVGVASVSAVRGLPGHGAYCASKAGVVAYAVTTTAVAATTTAAAATAAATTVGAATTAAATTATVGAAATAATTATAVGAATTTTSRRHHHRSRRRPPLRPPPPPKPPGRSSRGRASLTTTARPSRAWPFMPLMAA